MKEWLHAHAVCLFLLPLCRYYSVNGLKSLAHRRTYAGTVFPRPPRYRCFKRLLNGSKHRRALVESRGAHVLHGSIKNMKKIRDANCSATLQGRLPAQNKHSIATCTAASSALSLAAFTLRSHVNSSAEGVPYIRSGFFGAQVPDNCLAASSLAFWNFTCISMAYNRQFFSRAIDRHSLNFLSRKQESQRTCR